MRTRTKRSSRRRRRPSNPTGSSRRARRSAGAVVAGASVAGGAVRSRWVPPPHPRARWRRTGMGREGKTAASRLGAGNGIAEGDHSVGDEESDAERRRRRGRRGGRRRTRRDGVVEPSFEEPRRSPDLVAILPTPDVEEQEPMAVEAMASASTEVRDAVIERLSPPEFASETYDRAESTQTGREVETPALERVAAADEIRAEVSGGVRSDSSGSASPYRPSLQTNRAQQ